MEPIHFSSLTAADMHATAPTVNMQMRIFAIGVMAGSEHEYGKETQRGLCITLTSLHPSRTA